MAVRTEVSILSQEQLDQIRTLLYFQPKEAFIPGLSRSASFQPPVLFYRQESGTTSDKKEKNFLFLPYFFSTILFRKNLAWENTWPRASFRFTGTLFYHQQDLVKSAEEHLRHYGTTTLSLPPGAGKTVLGAYLASRLQCPTAVLVHRKTLLKQWNTTFETYTNARTWRVGEEDVPSGTYERISEGKTDVPSGTAWDVLLCMDRRVDSIDPSVRAKIGFLIVDEAHQFCTLTRSAVLLKFQPQYVMAETATLKREDDMHKLIYALCGTHEISTSLRKPFDVYKILTHVKGTRKMVSRGSKRGIDWTVLKKSLAVSEPRNRWIVRLVQDHPTRKVLILTDLVDHVKRLESMLKECGESVDSLYGSKKTYSDSRVLIGTVGKIGTGFDEATFCEDYGGTKINLLVICFSTKNVGRLEQTVGRVFRSEFPQVLHLVDDDPTIRRHWNVARRWYLSRGGIVHET